MRNKNFFVVVAILGLVLLDGIFIKQQLSDGLVLPVLVRVLGSFWALP